MFVIAKSWKQPKCISASEQINKLCHIHTVDVFSVIRSGKRINYKGTQINSWGEGNNSIS